MPRPRTGAQGLQDYLPKKDLTADTWAYNNTLDRFRMELPPSGDPGASGVVQLNLDNWEGFLPVNASGAMIVYDSLENNWDQLTSPSVTSSLNVIDHSKHTFQYTIDAINTNVSVGASGSLDNVNWFNLDADDELTTQTIDGTYGMTFDGMTKYVLFAFMAETGGTSVTITPRYLGGH